MTHMDVKSTVLGREAHEATTGSTHIFQGSYDNNDEDYYKGGEEGHHTLLSTVAG